MSHGEGPLLIVDDDQSFADTLVLEFTDRGYSVEWLDGLQAVANKSDLNHRYAVIDLRLRQDSGLDVIKIVKARSPSTVIVALTGYSNQKTTCRALELGASACLTKPVEIDRLESALLSGGLRGGSSAQSKV